MMRRICFMLSGNNLGEMLIGRGEPLHHIVWGLGNKGNIVVLRERDVYTCAAIFWCIPALKCWGCEWYNPNWAWFLNKNPPPSPGLVHILFWCIQFNDWCVPYPYSHISHQNFPWPTWTRWGTWNASTNRGCWDIWNIRGGADSFTAICLLKCRPVGGPTLCGASQGKQTHWVQVCPNYIALLSTPEITLMSFSYICIDWEVHSDRSFWYPGTYILHPLCWGHCFTSAWKWWGWQFLSRVCLDTWLSFPQQ